MTTLDREVTALEWLTGYVTGSLSLAELEDRTASALFEAGATPGLLPEQLRSIELYLAEYSSGHLDEPALRELLTEMTHNYRLEVFLDGDTGLHQRTGTISVTVGEADSWSRPGTPLVVAFG